MCVAARLWEVRGRGLGGRSMLHGQRWAVLARDGKRLGMIVEGGGAGWSGVI